MDRKVRANTSPYIFVLMRMSEFHALTNLLDDPDSEIYSHVEQKMVNSGLEIIPMLENVWQKSGNMLVQTRIEGIIDLINFNLILEEYSVWKSLDNPDLIDALVILNRMQYASHDCKPYYVEIEEKVREIWLEINENLTAFELVNVINKVVFDMWKFTTIHDSDKNSFQYHFFSDFMESKCGNQFSMGCFYLILAEKLDLPILPVLLEDQLILTYLKEHKTFDHVEFDDILFYINPNERGIIFDEYSIKKWVEKHELNEKDSYFLPSSNKQLINAYLLRLISGYEQVANEKKAVFLHSLLR